MRVLLKRARIIDSKSIHSKQIRDIFINDGIIRGISSDISFSCDHLIENENLHVSNGWFDPCVSFGEPGYEERETLNNGLSTAAKSGFTAIVLNPNTLPVIDTHSSIGHLAQLTKDAPCNLYICGSLTKAMNGIELSPLYDLHRAGGIAFGDYKKEINDPHLLKVALQYVQSFGGLIVSFPQIESLNSGTFVGESDFSLDYGLKGSPVIAETIALLRDIEVLKYSGGNLHFQLLTSKCSVDIIRQAKELGVSISCSVGLPHITFEASDMVEFNPNLKQNPPLRTKEDVSALSDGLKDGIINMVTSMHEPINRELKQHDIADVKEGSIGLEATFGILNSKFGLTNTIDFLTRGRKSYGLKEPKIEVGHKANLSLFNPDINYVFDYQHIHSTSKNCAYIKKKVKGKVLGTILGEYLTLNT